MNNLNSEGPRAKAIEEFSSLTDWQIVQMFILPAQKRAEEIRQRNGLPTEIGKVVDKDKEGKPVVPSLAFLVSKYMAVGCPRDKAIAGAIQQIEAFKKQHGLK